MGKIATIPFQRPDGIPSEISPESPIPAYIMGGQLDIDVQIPPSSQQYDGNGAAWVCVQNWGQVSDTIRQAIEEMGQSFDVRTEILQAAALTDLAYHNKTLVEVNQLLQDTFGEIGRRIRLLLFIVAGWAILSTAALVVSIFVR